MKRIAGVVASVCLASMMVACGFGGGGNQPQQQNAQKKWTREELKAAVIGKTVSQVKELLGLPTGTHNDPERDETGEFRYWDIVLNQHTQKLDAATIEFNRGKCVGLRTH